MMKKYTLKVNKVLKQTDKAVSVHFDVPENGNYSSGQFLTLIFDFIWDCHTTLNHAGACASHLVLECLGMIDTLVLIVVFLQSWYAIVGFPHVTNYYTARCDVFLD